MKRYREKAKNSSVGMTPGKVFRVRVLFNRDVLYGFLLLLITLFAYHPAWNGKPLWDDDGHMTRPELRSVAGLVKIWVEPGASQQYYPLVHTVFWVEHRLWGDAPMGYHLLNILLHALSTLLLYRIVRGLAIPGAWLAAALFALHPIEVESVAWISELKNCLSGALFFSAILLYLQFVRKRTLPLYAGSFCFFALGLMSKTIVAIMPAAALVILWWRHSEQEEFNWKKEFYRLMPFFGTGIAFGLFTAWMEHHYIIGNEVSTFNMSLLERCLIAGRVVWFYLGKLIFPSNLTFIYPRWEVSPAAWWQYLFSLAVAAVTLVCWFFRRRSKTPLAALLYFVGMLFPALGFFNVYPFRYSFVADHFQYLAGIGPIVLAAGAASRAFRVFGKRGESMKMAVCGGVLLIFTTMTWRQCRMYADVETLYRATIHRNPGCWMAYNNLGVEYLGKGRVNEGIALYRRSLEINPDNADAHNNLGVVLIPLGKTEEALFHFRRAVEISPSFAKGHCNFGDALQQLGRTDEAIAEYRKAVDLNPRYVEAFINLANTLMRARRPGEAVDCYQKALTITPSDLAALNFLCQAYAQIGKADSAIFTAEKALALAKSAGREALARKIAGDIREIEMRQSLQKR